MEPPHNAILKYERDIHRTLDVKKAQLASMQAQADQVGETMLVVEDLPKRLTHKILGEPHSMAPRCLLHQPAWLSLTHAWDPVMHGIPSCIATLMIPSCMTTLLILACCHVAWLACMAGLHGNH